MTTFLFFGVFLLLSGGGDGNCRRTPVSSLSDTVGSFPAFVRDNFLSEQCLSSRKTGILLPRCRDGWRARTDDLMRLLPCYDSREHQLVVVTLSPYVMADLYNPHRQELELTELGTASRTASRWSCPRTVPNRRRTATA